MVIEARIEGGAVLRFPDGTTPEVVQSTVQRFLSSAPQGQPATPQPAETPQAEPGIQTRRGRDIFGTQTAPALEPQTEAEKLAAEQGFFQAGAISTGRGLAKIGRALGLVEPETETEREAFEALGKAQPVAATVGEVVGESLPFAAVPVGAVASVPARVAASAGLGALEGGLIRRGEDATESEQLKGAGIGGVIAGGLEASLPVIGRIGGQLVRKFLKRQPSGPLLTAAGEPTEELAEALTQSGIDFNDLQDAAIELISSQQAGAVPEQVARAARFEEAGIPATRGDITQEFSQQTTESRLFEAAADPLGDPLRSLRLEQSQGLRGNLEKTIEKAGIPENIGSALKDALSGRKAVLKSKKNALYKAAAAAADDAGSLPFPVDGIEGAIPDKRTFREIGDLSPGQTESVLNLLAEFGIDKSEEGLKRLKDKGIEEIALDIGSFDIFRKSLNRIERSDKTGAIKVITGPIKDALDNEAENLATTLQKAGVTDKNVLDPLKEARETVRTLKTEFSPQAITGRLIDVKRDGVTPVIEASQVFKNIVGTNKPIELLDRTITSLKKAGPKGIEAIGDLQAATVFDLLESAFKAETRKVQGVKTFGTVPFEKRLAQIGDDKLKLIFSTNPGLLKDLKKVSALAKDLTPPSGAVPKGSASVILDSMNKLGIMSILGKIPGGGLFAEGLTRLAEGQANRAALNKALDARPELKRVVSVIESELPSIAVAFGLMGAAADDNQQQQIQTIR